MVPLLEETWLPILEVLCLIIEGDESRSESRGTKEIERFSWQPRGSA